VRERSYPIDVIAVPPKVYPHAAAIGPTQVRKRLRERGEVKLIHRIVFGARHEHADAPHPLGLRPRHYRPYRRAPERRNKLSPPHLSCLRPLHRQPIPARDEGERAHRILSRL